MWLVLHVHAGLALITWFFFQGRMNMDDVNQVMEKLDKNKDDVVDFKEFCRCVTLLTMSFYRKKTGKVGKVKGKGKGKGKKGKGKGKGRRQGKGKGEDEDEDEDEDEGEGEGEGEDNDDGAEQD